MPSQNSSEPLRGYVVDLMDHIMEHIRNVQNLSLKYTISLGPDDKYGNPIEGTRRWDGLIGELMEHVSFIFLCISSPKVVSLWPLKQKFLDSSSSFYVLILRILMCDVVLKKCRVFFDTRKLYGKTYVTCVKQLNDV